MLLMIDSDDDDDCNDIDEYKDEDDNL